MWSRAFENNSKFAFTLDIPEIEVHAILKVLRIDDLFSQGLADIVLLRNKLGDGKDVLLQPRYLV